MPLFEGGGEGGGVSVTKGAAACMPVFSVAAGSVICDSVESVQAANAKTARMSAAKIFFMAFGLERQR